MNLYNYNIEYDIFKSFDRELIFEYKIMPLCYEELFLLIATSDDSLEEQELNKLFNHPVKIVVVPHEELQFEWRYYEIKSKLYFLTKNMLNRLSQKEDTKEVAEFVDLILLFTIQNNASDIHLESLEKSIVIRLRIDGVLRQFFRFDIQVFSILSTYLKYLSNLDISDKRTPLNSRISKYVIDRVYDIRISTLPTIYGESIVLRILNSLDTKKDLDSIGFEQSILKKLKEILVLKQGLFLVTGPTGSGKTTTLYSMIQQINSLEKKIITIEDPVEYKIEGVMQVNINEDIGLDYHKVLKNILRQDPDILLIGEIRDKESLKIAIQAALTGHLVLATLHTNSSVETIHRLLDLEAESYLVASTLKGVLSQRLVRVLCTKCKERKENIYIKKGCKVCNYSGYKNRQVVCELLATDDEVKNFILNNKNLDELLKYLINQGFQTLQSNCKKLIENGTTSYEEYLNKV